MRSAEAEALKEAENYSKEDEGVQKRRKELCTKVPPATPPRVSKRGKTLTDRQCSKEAEIVQKRPGALHPPSRSSITPYG